MGPSWPLADGKATLGVPVKLGFSLSDYYEPTGKIRGSAISIVGALITVPLSGAPTKVGTWNLHGGVNYLALGDGTESLQR